MLLSMSGGEMLKSAVLANIGDPEHTLTSTIRPSWSRSMRFGRWMASTLVTGLRMLPQDWTPLFAFSRSEGHRYTHVRGCWLKCELQDDHWYSRWCFKTITTVTTILAFPARRLPEESPKFLLSIKRSKSINSGTILVA
jgi:hypothetical protein